MRRKTFSLCSKDNKHWAFKWRKVVTLGGGTANSEICLSGSTQRMSINIVLKSVFRVLAVSPPCSKMGNGVWPSFCTTLIGQQFDGLLAWFQRLGLAYRCPNIHDVQPTHFSFLLTKSRLLSVGEVFLHVYTSCLSNKPRFSLFLYSVTRV